MTAAPVAFYRVCINGRQFFVPPTVNAAEIRRRVRADARARVEWKDNQAKMHFGGKPGWAPMPEGEATLEASNRYEFRVQEPGSSGGCSFFEQRDENGNVISRGFACRRGRR